MAPNYWLDLFTGTTWEEFLDAGAKVSGFREKKKNACQRIRPGDFLLCYCTGISRWIGLLEVTGPVYHDEETQIWAQDPFPWRLPVKVRIQLKPENGVPVLNLSDRLSYFQNLKSPHAWTGHFRGSPVQEKRQDALAVIEALEDARDNPRENPYDEKKYRRLPHALQIYKTKGGMVTIPEEEEADAEEEPAKDTHEEIQWIPHSADS